MLLPSVRLLDEHNRVLHGAGATTLLVELTAMLDTVRDALQSMEEGGMPPQLVITCRVSSAVRAARCLHCIVEPCRDGWGCTDSIPRMLCATQCAAQLDSLCQVLCVSLCSESGPVANGIVCSITDIVGNYQFFSWVLGAR